MPETCEYCAKLHPCGCPDEEPNTCRICGEDGYEGCGHLLFAIGQTDLAETVVPRDIETEFYEKAFDTILKFIRRHRHHLRSAFMEAISDSNDEQYKWLWETSLSQVLKHPNEDLDELDLRDGIYSYVENVLFTLSEECAQAKSSGENIIGIWNNFWHTDPEAALDDISKTFKTELKRFS